MSTELDDALRTVEQRARRYAERGPYHLFPDDVVLRNLLHKMALNLVEYGSAYCPCRPVSGDASADRPNICPCRSHREEIARDGHCECRLYVSDAFLAARETSGERRCPEGEGG